MTITNTNISTDCLKTIKKGHFSIIRLHICYNKNINYTEMLKTFHTLTGKQVHRYQIGVLGDPSVSLNLNYFGFLGKVKTSKKMWTMITIWYVQSSSEDMR